MQRCYCALSVTVASGQREGDRLMEISICYSDSIMKYIYIYIFVKMQASSGQREGD